MPIKRNPVKPTPGGSSIPARFNFHSIPLERRLTLLANFELSIGHVRIAEKLSHAAEALREISR